MPKGVYKHKSGDEWKDRNSPMTNNGGYLIGTPQNEHAQIISNALQEATRYLKAKPVKSSEEAEQRIVEYFTHCIQDGKRPTVENLALCLGVTRQTLWEYENLLNRTVNPDVIKKAKEFIASFDAEMVSEGKLNPVTYIFRSKNYYGMKDTQEYLLAPKTEAPSKKTLIDEAEMLPEGE